MLSRPAGALATDSAAVGIHSLCVTLRFESEAYVLRAGRLVSEYWLSFLNLKIVEKSIAKSCQRS